MKCLSTLVIFLVVCLSLSAEDMDKQASWDKEKVNKENCTFKGIPLYGKVKVKDLGLATFNVRIVKAGEDIRVQTKEYADDCGEWQLVDSNEDFSISFVNCGEDFSIRFVAYDPGMR